MNKQMGWVMVVALLAGGCAVEDGSTGEDGEDERLGEVQQDDVGGLKVYCRGPERGVECSRRCFAQSIPCVYAALHPYKASEPQGLLSACNKSFPLGYMCTYEYPNGDNCYFPFGRRAAALCSYQGGAE
jgi:hypothetical protein